MQNNPNQSTLFVPSGVSCEVEVQIMRGVGQSRGDVGAPMQGAPMQGCENFLYMIKERRCKAVRIFST
jgi:hypothetical protein